MKLKLTGLIAVVVGLFTLMTMAGSFYTIDEGERGVKTRYGKVVGTVEPGLGFKFPFVEDIESFDVRTVKVGYSDIYALTKDLQKVEVDVILNYQVDALKVEDIYSTLGHNYSERIINPAILDVTKQVVGQFTAQKSVDERAIMAEQMSTQLNEELQDYGMLVHQVQIQDVTFSPEFLNSVESRMQAEIEVQKREQNLEQEKIQADIVRTQADARAYDKLAQAKAEAESIDMRGKALRANPELVGLITAEKWDGKLPTTMPPNGTVPFLNMKK